MISFATSQLRWTFITAIAIGIGIGVQIGRWSVFLAMSRTRIVVAEWERRYRLRRLRRCG